MNSSQKTWVITWCGFMVFVTAAIISYNLGPKAPVINNIPKIYCETR